MLRILSLIALFIFLAVAPSRADERILLFDSDIDVQSDGTLTVTETIRVTAEGRQIRRGIFRDFPTRVENADGREVEVPFKVLSVTKNGQPEPFHTEKVSRAVRIYVGSRDVFLHNATYEYAITYETSRQIRYFENHDELIWNVTGNFWSFPIDGATATVSLPQGAAIEDVNAFTGRFGSTESDATARANGNIAQYRTTRGLSPREGLTIGVKFPKGVVAAPSQEQLTRWWLKEHMGEIAASIGLLLTGFYYFWAWGRVGRDPPSPNMVPRWDMPEGVSPALTHYIEHKGLKGAGFKAISAAALSLAVKGYLDLVKDGGEMLMLRTPKAREGTLPVGERALLDKVVRAGGSMAINKKNGTAVKGMASYFSSAMAKEHRSVYYKSNVSYIIPGFLLTIVTILFSLIMGGIGEEAIPFLIFGIVGSVFASVFITAFAKQTANGLAGKIRTAFLIFFGVAMFINLGSMSAQFSDSIRDIPLVVPLIITLVLLNILFFFLMGAPTKLGAKRQAEIDGLKRYLSVAEEDRMNMLGSPEMSPQHYETLLPYAVALDLEKPWSNAFQGWLATAIAAGTVAAGSYYGPRWYNGGTSNIGVDDIGDTFGNLAGDLSKSMTASMPAPKSSSSGFSGGGGGFSGGGGGGGGGGGW